MQATTAVRNNNLNQLIRDSARYLRRAGIESPAADIEIMLMHILRCRRVDLYLGDIDITDEQLAVFRDYLEQRSTRKPAQYITGIANFMGFDFIVKPGVFIPRPETELLVEEALKTVTGHQPAPSEVEGPPVTSPKILDLCTGSGCIAIALAKLIQDCEIVATDISETALEVARENAKLHGVKDKVAFLQGDLFDALTPLGDIKFDIIISNPPYIKAGDLDNLPAEVQYEPRLALDGGEGCERFYRRIQALYKKYSSHSPRLFIEILSNIAI